MVHRLAAVENDMTSIERTVYCARDAEQEPPHKIPQNIPAAPWSGVGQVETGVIVLIPEVSPWLLTVLTGLSLDIKGRGEVVTFERYVFLSG